MCIMNNFRVLTFVLLILVFKCDYVFGRCDDGNVGRVACMKYSHFSDEQYGICQNVRDVSRKLNHGILCVGILHGDFCWIPCMYYIYQQDSGHVYSTCKCSDHVPKNNIFLKIKQFFFGSCPYPSDWEACQWLEKCLLNNGDKTNMKQRIFDKLPLYKQFCEGNIENISEMDRFLNKLFQCVNIRLLVCRIDNNSCKNLDLESVFLECLFIRNIYVGTNDFFCNSREDKDVLFQTFMIPMIPMVVSVLHHFYSGLEKTLECMLDKSNSIRLIRLFLMDKLSFQMTADKLSNMTVNKLQLSNGILWQLYNMKNDSTPWIDLLVYDNTFKTLDFGRMFKVRHRFPIYIYEDKNGFRISKIATCKTVDCAKQGHFIGGTLRTRKTMICTDDELQDIVDFSLISVDENHFSFDCCPGSDGGQCVALVKCQCHVPWTGSWIPGRLVKDHCDSIEKGTVIATFNMTNNGTYGNRLRDHAAIFHRCNSAHIQMYGQACNRRIQLETLREDFTDHNFYEVTINDSEQRPEQTAHCRRRYGFLRGETDNYRCNITHIEELLHQPVNTQRDEICSIFLRENLVGCHCNAPGFSSWIPGLRISQNCSSVPEGSVVAEFQNASVRARYQNNGLVGVMLRCNTSYVEMYTQDHNTQYVHVITVTDEEQSFNNLYQVTCDTDAGCQVYANDNC